MGQPAPLVDPLAAKSVDVQSISEKRLKADVNNDGKTDLINISHLKGVGLRIRTLFSNGDGTWTDAQDEPWPDYRDDNTAFWKVSEINGDGKADLVNMYHRNPGLRVHSLLSDGKGSWIRASHDLWNDYGDNDMKNWKVADFNGDGLFDWVDVYLSPSGLRVHSLISQGDGTWRIVQDDPWNSYPFNDVESWKVLDINGDGKEDLFNVLHTNQNLRILSLLSKGNGSWTTNQHDVWPDYEYKDAALWKTAHLDSDRNGDLISVVRTPSGLRFDFLVSKGDGTWINHRQDIENSSSENGFTTWEMANVHGDQKEEVLCFYQANQNLSVHVFGLDANGKWKRDSHQSWNGLTMEDLRKWKIADVNGDGKDDLVQLDCAQSKLSILTVLSAVEGNWRTQPRQTLPFCPDSTMWNWKSSR